MSAPDAGENSKTVIYYLFSVVYFDLFSFISARRKRFFNDCFAPVRLSCVEACVFALHIFDVYNFQVEFSCTFSINVPQFFLFHIYIGVRFEGIFLLLLQLPWLVDTIFQFFQHGQLDSEAGNFF